MIDEWLYQYHSWWVAALLFPQNGVFKKMWGSWKKFQRFGGDPEFNSQLVRDSECVQNAIGLETLVSIRQIELNDIVWFNVKALSLNHNVTV